MLLHFCCLPFGFLYIIRPLFSFVKGVLEFSFIKPGRSKASPGCMIELEQERVGKADDQHSHVQKIEIDLLARQLQSSLSIVGREYTVALPREQKAQQLADLLFVVGNRNTGFSVFCIDSFTFKRVESILLQLTLHRRNALGKGRMAILQHHVDG